jgi:hypothetical protein
LAHVWWSEVTAGPVRGDSSNPPCSSMSITYETIAQRLCIAPCQPVRKPMHKADALESLPEMGKRAKRPAATYGPTGEGQDWNTMCPSSSSKELNSLDQRRCKLPH